MNLYLNTPPVVKNLIIANLLVYLATALVPAIDGVAAYCQLFWVQSPYFHTWQFITYMFLHGGFTHLFFNMFALWMFGRWLEPELGQKRFMVYYLVCGVGAALIQMGVAWLTHDFGIVLLGASGAVFGVLLAFGVMHPNEMIYISPLPFPIKAKWFVLGYAVLELLLGSTGLQRGIAHFAHVGGMLWGWLLLLYWKHKDVIRF